MFELMHYSSVPVIARRDVALDPVLLMWFRRACVRFPRRAAARFPRWRERSRKLRSSTFRCRQGSALRRSGVPAIVRSTDRHEGGAALLDHAEASMRRYAGKKRARKKGSPPNALQQRQIAQRAVGRLSEEKAGGTKWCIFCAAIATSSLLRALNFCMRTDM